MSREMFSPSPTEIVWCRLGPFAVSYPLSGPRASIFSSKLLNGRWDPQLHAHAGPRLLPLVGRWGFGDMFSF
jgi:hypothetical protein